MRATPHHATCVAVGDHGVLITGAAGRGKSTLALQLMAFGAQLVADDQVLLSCENDTLTARCPDILSGVIEARGVGVLNADPVASAPVRLPRREVTLLGCNIPLLHGAETIHLAPAILQWMRAGRSER